MTLKPLKQLADTAFLFLKRPFYGYCRLEKPTENTESLKSELKKNGYVVLRSIFSETEIKNITAHINKMLAREVRGGIKIEYEEDATTPRQIWDFVFRDWKLTRQIVLHRKLLAYVSDILGYQPFLFRSSIMLKKAETGSELDWHQDHAYWAISPAPVYSAWIALDEATQENGGMKFIKGGHKGGLKEFKVGRQNSVRQVLIDDHSQEVVVPCRAGDVILFDSLIPHATGANRTLFDRKAAICTYMSPDHSLSRKENGEGKWRLMI